MANGLLTIFENRTREKSDILNYSRALTRTSKSTALARSRIFGLSLDRPPAGMTTYAVCQLFWQSVFWCVNQNVSSEWMTAL